MLPEDNAPWPPEGLKNTYATVQRLADWYGDDVTRLYPATTGTLAGGTGRGSFWDRATRSERRVTMPNAGQGLTTMHVPVAADIAAASADLLFADLPDMTATKPDAAKRLDELSDALNLGAELVEGAELCAALGGIYWRESYDVRVIPDRPILQWVTPDRAIPEWQYGVLTGVTFWDVLPQPPRGQTGTWRHLERYSYELTTLGRVGYIEHGLYVGDDDTLGRRVPLEEHPALAGIRLNDPAGDRLVLPVQRMTAGYIPNMRPNREDLGSRQGRADIAGMFDPTGILPAIDKAWSSWMRDLDLGKARAFVPDEYLRDLGPGNGAVFDIDRAIYSTLRMPLSNDGHGQITVFQPAIRVSEHQATIEALFATAVDLAGYSGGTFGIKGADAAPQTATEARQRLAKTMQTREKKTRYWTPGTEELLETLLELDAAVFGGPGAGAEVEVEFRDSVAEDPHRTAETVALLFQAQAASTKRRVEIVNPDWDPADVDAEVLLIDEANTIPVPAPVNDSESADGGGFDGGAPAGQNQSEGDAVSR